MDFWGGARGRLRCRLALARIFIVDLSEMETGAAPDHRVDWQSWASAAGLTEWEKKAVEYKTSGVHREEALRRQPDEVSRRALQAAWKRLERTGEERLRKKLPESPRIEE